MHMGMLWRCLICIFVFSLCLYLYIHQQNKLTELRLLIPAQQKEITRISQENTLLSYKLEKFENPTHLLQLAEKPEFSYLKQPSIEEIWMISPPPYVKPKNIETSLLRDQPLETNSDEEV